MLCKISMQKRSSWWELIIRNIYVLILKDEYEHQKLSLPSLIELDRNDQRETYLSTTASISRFGEKYKWTSYS